MSDDHVVKIQASIRGKVARNDHAEKHGAAITIQALHRGSIHRSKDMRDDENFSGEEQSDAGSRANSPMCAEQPSEQAAPKKRDSTFIKSSNKLGDVVEKRGSFQKGSMRKSVFEGHVRKEGVLEKKGTGGIKSWSERFFTCQGHYLRYKDSKTAQQSGPDESWTKGTINLNTVTQIDVKIEGEKKPLLKIQAGGLLIKLRAASGDEVKSWADACLAGMDDPLVREIKEDKGDEPLPPSTRATTFTTTSHHLHTPSHKPTNQQTR
jgi:hypothetical protein